MTQMIATLDPQSRAATRGWSDVTIRNLFVIPTVGFLIVFNVFPLLYSLYYSFTDFKANVRNPVNFVASTAGRMIVSRICSVCASLRMRESQYAPIPPVFGPVSPSLTRL